jgi:hypothetical protein
MHSIQGEYMNMKTREHQEWSHQNSLVTRSKEHEKKALCFFYKVKKNGSHGALSFNFIIIIFFFRGLARWAWSGGEKAKW